MTRRTIPFFIILILISLPACASATPLSNGDQVLTIVNLQVTPALTHWLPKVAACANAIPTMGVNTQILPPEGLNLEDADMILRLGERQNDEPFTAVMGMEELVVIAGGEVPLSSLNNETLRSIYTGGLNNWGEVNEITTAGIEIDQAIHVLSFPEGYELKRLFEEAYLDVYNINPSATVFSTMNKLKAFLTENPYSIAYLFKSQVPDGFQPLNITGFNPQSAQVYVLAVTHQEPTGIIKQLLLCLQDSQRNN